MPSSKKLIDRSAEVRELLVADLEKFKPAAEALPTSLRKKLGVRGPQVAPTKERITIRLSADVVSTLRATGAGWQSRMDTASREWFETHRPSAAKPGT